MGLSNRGEKERQSHPTGKRVPMIGLSLSRIREFYEEEGEVFLSNHLYPVVDPGTLGLHYLIKTELRDIKEKVILDLGCGPCLVTSCFYFGGARVIGMDIAKSKIKKLKEVIDVVQAAGESIPIKDKSVDITLCTEVLEHVLDPEVVLEEILRVTREYAILSFPSCTSIEARFRYLLSAAGRLKNIRWGKRKYARGGSGKSEPLTQLVKGSSGHLRTITYRQLLRWANRYHFRVLGGRGYEILCENSGSRKAVEALNILLSFFPLSRYFGTFVVAKISPAHDGSMPVGSSFFLRNRRPWRS